VVRAADPITDILARDWASVGGWALFLGLVILIVTGAFREWWVPGARSRRTEEALKHSLELNRDQSGQIDKLITANEITKHFFEETTPHRRPPSTADDGGGDPA